MVDSGQIIRYNTKQLLFGRKHLWILIQITIRSWDNQNVSKEEKFSPVQSGDTVEYSVLVRKQWWSEGTITITRILMHN